jgi:hypothetical protein
MLVRSAARSEALHLVSCRKGTRKDLMRARHPLSKLALRHGSMYAEGTAWTGKHGAGYVRTPMGTSRSRPRSTLPMKPVCQTNARRYRLDTVIEQMAADSQFTPMVNRLDCLWGLRTLTGSALAVEITDWDRLDDRCRPADAAPGGIKGSEQHYRPRRLVRSVGPASSRWTRFSTSHLRALKRLLSIRPRPALLLIGSNGRGETAANLHDWGFGDTASIERWKHSGSSSLSLSRQEVLSSTAIHGGTGTCVERPRSRMSLSTTRAGTPSAPALLRRSADRQSARAHSR